MSEPKHPKTKRTIREEAEFMALEIFEDRLAPKDEIADAIELAILRYAQPKFIPRDMRPPRP